MSTETDTPTRRKRRTLRERKRWWRSLLQFAALAVVAFVLAVLIKMLLLQVFMVPSDSMEPTLAPGDRIAVELVTSHFAPYRRGDIVVFKDPGGWVPNRTPNTVQNPLQWFGLLPDDAGYLVKRVIGTPGQTVVGLADGTLKVDGAVISDPWSPKVPQKPFTTALGAHEFFMMGDNRGNSADSRVHGPVPETDIVGRVFFTFWPWGRIGPSV